MKPPVPLPTPIKRKVKTIGPLSDSAQQGFSYGRITDDTVHFSFTDDPMIIRMVLFTDDPMIILMVLSTDDPMIKFRFFCRILQAIR